MCRDPNLANMAFALSESSPTTCGTPAEPWAFARGAKTAAAATAVEKSILLLGIRNSLAKIVSAKAQPKAVVS